MDDPAAQQPDGPGLRARPRVGIVGAGRVGTALGVALDRAGWPVVAVTSRDAARRARFRSLVPSAVDAPDAGAIGTLADLVLVTVPDDAIAEVAAGVRGRPGLALAHTSGALPAGILDAARPSGSTIASFHPLVPFADVERAVAALAGASVAIEGDTVLVLQLEQLARDLGARPVRITAEGKATYHAAAVLAAGGFVALLDVIVELGRASGMDAADALAAYGPLIRQGLANAEGLGTSAALTGPVPRGDRRTVALHVEAIEQLAPDALDLYRATALRQLAIAIARGDLAADRADELRSVIERPTG